MVEDPVGVAADVVSVSVDEQAGLQDAGEDEAVAPVGRPEAEKETDCAVPETRVAVIVLDTDCRWTTVLFPPLESEKSNADAEPASTLQMVVVPVPVVLDK